MNPDRKGPRQDVIMAGKKAQDNSKKAAGNARKADSAAKKNAAAETQREQVEDDKWQKGSKDTSKKYVHTCVCVWRGGVICYLKLPRLALPRLASHRTAT